MCEKRYSLIVFLDEKEIERSETVQVDIVPSKWIFCDDHNKLVCPFINESTKDKINLLHKLVRENKPADSSWNNYRVEVRGTADTYKEGLEKLKILRTQAYAFSTDNEQHILKKQDSIKKQCRLKGMAKKKIKNKSLEDVGTFDLSTDDEMGNSKSSQILADSDDNSSSNTLSKKSTTSSDVQSYLQNPLPSWLKQSFDKLTYQIGTIQSELIIIKEELAEIKEIRTSVVRQVKEKQKKHDLNLPFNALNDFLLFDENLKTDKSLREEVISMILPLISAREKISKSLTTVMTKFLTRNVTLEFTAVKQIKGKHIFKQTSFCAYLPETIQLEYTNSKKADIFKEKDFYGAVGIVLNNSRDWHGYREKRKLQNQEKLDKNQEENTENPTNSNEEML